MLFFNIFIENAYNKIDVRKKVRYNTTEVIKLNIINITNARSNLFKLVQDVNIGYNPITIVNNKGKNAVLISEEEWKNIEETLYLSSIPGYIENINNIRNNEVWEETEEYNKNEKW